MHQVSYKATRSQTSKLKSNKT